MASGAGGDREAIGRPRALHIGWELQDHDPSHPRLPVTIASRPGQHSARRPPARPGSRQRAASAVAGATVWGLFAGYRIWRTVAGPALQWQDSTTYEAASRHPVASLAFLAGQRAPVAPLLWKLTGNPGTYVVTQAVIAVVAWSVLAATVARLVRPGWPALVAWTATLGFATCWQIVEWDWSVLSESISLSAVAVIAASTIWCWERLTLPRAATLVVACVAYEEARDQAIWAVGATSVVILVYCGARAIAGRRRRPPRASPTPAATSAVAALALVLLATAALAEAGAAYANRNAVNLEDVFYVRVLPFPQRVAWFADHGMPEAGALDAVARASTAPAGRAKVVAPDLASPDWAPLRTWFETRAETTFLGYVATHPVFDLTAPFRRPQLSFNDADGNLAFYGGFGHREGNRSTLPVLASLLWPPWDIDAVVAAGAVAVLSVRRRWPRRLLAAAATLAATGAVSMLIAWQGDGMEVARHTVEGNAETRVALLLLAIVAVLPASNPEPAARADP